MLVLESGCSDAWRTHEISTWWSCEQQNMTSEDWQECNRAGLRDEVHKRFGLPPLRIPRAMQQCVQEWQSFQNDMDRCKVEVERLQREVSGDRKIHTWTQLLPKVEADGLLEDTTSPWEHKSRLKLRLG